MSDQNFIEEMINIIPKPESITYEEITTLLHLAFKERSEQGLNYKAIHQDVQTTINRIGDGTCLVAIYEKQLIGTGSIAKKTGSKWYHGETYGYISQFAVHPDFKRRGIGELLLKRSLQLCEELKVDAAIAKTASKAQSVINLNIKNGAQKLDFTAGDHNYYSIYFRWPIQKKQINPLYCWFRYNLSKITCVITRKNGKFTLVGKFVNFLLRKKREYFDD